MKKISVFSFIFMLMLAAGFTFSSGVSAQVVMVDENYSVRLNENDKILYQKDLETDADKLYALANEKNNFDSQSTESTLVQYKEGASTLSDTNTEIEIESKSYLQHYMTIQRESGEIEKYYCVDSFTDIPTSVFDKNASSGRVITSEGEIVTPGAGAYDSSYSARAWAKIHYMEGYQDSGSSYFEYIEPMWYRGTVQRVDSSVSVSNRRIWIRNTGFELDTRYYQNLTKGPYYAPSGSDTVTVNKPYDFYTLLSYPDFYYEMVCTCQADLVHGSSKWYLETSIRKSTYGINM